MAIQGVPLKVEINQPNIEGWDPLKVYCYYRVFISLMLFGVFLTRFAGYFGTLNPELYFEASALYLVVTFFTLILVSFSDARSSPLTFVVILIDIIFISLLAYTSGGIISNLSILLVVAVAAGGILLIGQVATLVAAIATMAILYEQFYFSVIMDMGHESKFMQAGLLGIAFFGTSLLSQQLSIRLRESELIASQQASELADLQELNHYIIQRMRTGIVVVNQKRKIRLVNESAWQMLGMPENSTHSTLDSLSPELTERLKKWQQNSEIRCNPFRALMSGPEISANFTQLSAGNNDDTLIFLDDTSRTAQQAQQLKLASLGRLTAGIAHEIRNPLGAISHAAQLLSESEELNKADARLTEIIQQHSVRMNFIIENVLQLSRRKQPKPELLYLKAWLTKFLSDYEVTAPEGARINLNVYPESIKVRIDPTQLSQVLTNLTDNALRHSKQETGQASVVINGSVNDTSRLPFIEIIDKGPGIDPEKVENIFEPFFTTESTGTGLGLYIARELCESNQARLDYIPVPTGGACFRITFAHPNKAIAI